MQLIREAHKHCMHNKEQILKSDKIGCFYCLCFVKNSEIKQWVDRNGTTALCPYCSIDALIGDASGVEITEAFLESMYDYWFSPRMSERKQ